MMKVVFCLTICAVVLSACGSETRLTEFVVPEVSEALRRPVSVPTREVSTARDALLLAIDLTEAVEEANDKILTIDRILDEAERAACKIRDPPCTGG